MTPDGLTTVEARRRLAEFGPNEPTPPRRGAGLGEFLAFLANPLVVILLVASATATYLLLVEMVKRRLIGRLVPRTQ